MEKVKQTKEELEAHLSEQLEFLSASAESYDNGKLAEAKRMAVQIRVLLHDTDSSYSLLNQLGIKDSTLFLDSSSTQENILGSYTGLVLKGVGADGGTYVAPLDDLPPNQHFRPVSFDEYWNKPIFIDNSHVSFSRKDLILAVANTDGGAHVDPALKGEYVRLTKLNSLGWIFGNESKSGPLENASLAAIRQIGHEILKTLVHNYPEQKKLNSANGMLLGDIWIGKGAMGGVLVGNPQVEKNQMPKIPRNDPCPCGSGKKWKKCGYLETEEHKQHVAL